MVGVTSRVVRPERRTRRPTRLGAAAPRPLHLDGARPDPREDGLIAGTATLATLERCAVDSSTMRIYAAAMRASYSSSTIGTLEVGKEVSDERRGQDTGTF